MNTEQRMKPQPAAYPISVPRRATMRRQNEAASTNRSSMTDSGSARLVFDAGDRRDHAIVDLAAARAAALDPGRQDHGGERTAQRRKIGIGRACDRHRLVVDHTADLAAGGQSG